MATCALSVCPAPFISSIVKLSPSINAKKLPGVRLREYWVVCVAFGSRDPRYYINRKVSSSEVRERLDRVVSESREPVGPNRNKMSRKGPSDRPRSGTRQRRSTIKRCEAAAAALRERDGAMFTRHSAKKKYSGVQSASDGHA